MKKIHSVISAIFNPLMVAIISFGLIIYDDIILPLDHLLFFIAVIFTTILPFITITYFKKTGKITTLNTPIRKERIELLAISAIYNAFGFILFVTLGASPILKGLMFCYAINTAIVWQITRYWKISIHMIGIGGPIVALWIYGFNYPLIMLTIIIVVSISRIALNAHTLTQVVAGTALAMILAYFELTYLFL